MYSDNRIIQRGQIWYARLDGTGSQEQGNRPCIILQNEMANRYSSLVTVIPITSQNKKHLPTHTKIKSNMNRESIALAENIITIAKDMLISYIGKVNEIEMEQVENSVLIQLGILQYNQNKEVV